jgi:hypothetical protein
MALQSKASPAELSALPSESIAVPRSCYRVFNGGAMGQIDQTHRGIIYVVLRLGARRWRWQILPPDSAEGLHQQNGEIEGNIRDAVVAARRVIDRQTGKYTFCVARLSTGETGGNYSDGTGAGLVKRPSVCNNPLLRRPRIPNPRREIGYGDQFGSVYCDFA